MSSKNPNKIQMNILDFSLIKVGTIDNYTGKEMVLYLPLMLLSRFEKADASSKESHQSSLLYTCNLVPDKLLKFYTIEEIEGKEFIHDLFEFVSYYSRYDIPVIYSVSKTPKPYISPMEGEILSISDCIPIAFTAIQKINTFAELWGVYGLDFKAIVVDSGEFKAIDFITETDDIPCFILNLGEEVFLTDFQANAKDSTFMSKLDCEYQRFKKGKYYAIAFKDSYNRNSYFAGYRKVNERPGEVIIVYSKSIEEALLYCQEEISIYFVTNHWNYFNNQPFEIIEVDCPEPVRNRYPTR